MLEGWQRELVDAARVARLATIRPDGTSRLVPVCFALDGDEVVIAIDEKPKTTRQLARLRDLDRDPRATLLVDHYAEEWSELAWVRLDGEATVVATGARRPQALAALRRRYPQYETMDLEGSPLIAFSVSRVVAWRASG